MNTSRKLLAKALPLAAGSIALTLALSANVHAQAMGYAAGATGGGSRTPVIVSTPNRCVPPSAPTAAPAVWC